MIEHQRRIPIDYKGIIAKIEAVKKFKEFIDKSQKFKE